MSYYVNPSIARTNRVFPPQGRSGYLRLDMNENPVGLPQEFVSEVLKELTPEFLATYPEPIHFTKKYADFLSVGVDQLMTTNGSDMAIRYVFETFGEPGKKVVTVAPSFEMYWVNCSLLGLVHSPVPFDNNFQIKVEDILAAIDDDTSLVVLLNPNNPIGGAFAEEDIEKVVRCAQEHNAIVIIDEAYHYFYRHTCLPMIGKYDNVLLLRTFSKCFSMAACRLGVIISNPALIAEVTKARLSFDVNSIALLFAERLMDHPEVLEGLIATQEEGKRHLCDSLTAHGYTPIDCLGNYVLVKPKGDSHAIAETMEKEHRIFIKTFSNPLLKEYIRISTGCKEAMEKFLAVFYQLEV